MFMVWKEEAMSKEKYNLLWIDIETTGSDRSKDFLLEVGCFITDTDLNVWEGSERNWVIKPFGDDWLKRLIDEPDVLEMHSANGLIKQVAESSMTAKMFNDEMTAYIEQMFAEGGKKRFAFAGSGIAHFDRPFLETWIQRHGVEFPWINKKHFVYYSIDVGATRRILRDICGVDVNELTKSLSDSEKKTHRAIDDALMHFEEAKAYKNYVLDFG